MSVAIEQVDVGYHPETAVYPWLQQVTVDCPDWIKQLLLPVVMSLYTPAVLAAAYRAGLTKPSEGWPAAMRAALMSVIMPARTGVDADVPLTPTALPCE